MTNERAIQIIAAITEDNTKEDVIAKVFACEDVIERDVNDWLDMPLPIHLNQFIDHNNDTASKFIDQRCEIFGYDEGVKIEMHNLRDKMESVLIAMIKYAACYGAIAKEAGSER
jgi:hypothetical protein